MRVTATPTTKVVALVVDGHEVPARVWEAVTDEGVACLMYVTRVQVSLDEDQGAFEAALAEQSPPSPETEAIPLRMVL